MSGKAMRILFLALIILPLSAFAQIGELTCDETLVCSATIQGSWDAPTTREDGSALPVNQISGYDVQLADVGADVYEDQASCPTCERITEAAASFDVNQSVSVESVLNGEAVTYRFDVRAVDIAGRVADWSSVDLSLTFPQSFIDSLISNPSAIINIEITVQ